MSASQKTLLASISWTVESITVPLVWYPKLLAATPTQREKWNVCGEGYGIHWSEIDEDLSTEGLLRGAPAPRSQFPAKS